MGARDLLADVHERAGARWTIDGRSISSTVVPRYSTFPAGQPLETFGLSFGRRADMRFETPDHHVAAGGLLSLALLKHAVVNA